MNSLDHLFENNRAWSRNMVERDPEFFRARAKQQNPDYLWIGCADSRVPAEELTGLQPGDLFVHRNVANIVQHSDLNCLSVLQFAVDVLGVEHIIVCGHYGCGGVRAALRGDRVGLTDNWLQNIRDIRDRHRDAIPTDDETTAADRLSEINVIEQVTNVCQTTIATDAWERGQNLAVHGWIYGLADGRLRDLGVCITNADELPACYAEAVG